MPGQEIDQCFVRLAVHRARAQSDLDALAVPAGELGARRAGLHMQLEDHSAAAATRRAPIGKSSTCSRMNRIAGERSMFAIGGTKRRIGRRNGRTTASKVGASGA